MNRDKLSRFLLCSCTQDKFVMVLIPDTHICQQNKSFTLTNFWFRESLIARYRQSAKSCYHDGKNNAAIPSSVKIGKKWQFYYIYNRIAEKSHFYDHPFLISKKNIGKIFPTSCLCMFSLPPFITPLLLGESNDPGLKL
jgi:hypothetical protein